MNKKTDLRLNAKELRKTLDISQISINITNLIRQNIFYEKAQHVMLFYPTKYEVDIRGLFSDKKNFYLPRVNKSELEVCPYKPGDKLKKSKYNIFEPITDSVNPHILDMVIVPALMVDKNGYRLGYGGGYYDRFLSNKPYNTICPIPKELYVDILPHEPFDVQVKNIIVF